MRKAKIIRTRQVVSPLLTLLAAVALSGVTTVHASDSTDKTPAVNESVQSSATSQQEQAAATDRKAGTLSDDDLEKLIDRSDATPTQDILKMKDGVPSDQQEAWLTVAKRVADQDLSTSHREQVILYNETKIVVPAPKAAAPSAESDASNQASNASAQNPSSAALSAAASSSSSSAAASSSSQSKPEAAPAKNEAASAAATPAPVTDNRYVSVTDKNAVLYADLNGTKKQEGAAVYQRTFKSQAKYQKDGVTYLALYDANQTLQGYMNQASIKVAAGAGGVWTNASGYASLTKPGQDIYGNLDTKQVIKKSDDVLDNTYFISGAYHHLDGQVYYSLYDSHNNWLGYMAGSGFETVNSAEGAWAAASGYAKVVDKNYAIYNSFKFDATGSTDHYYQQYFKKVGQYHHVNGAVYYSVFDLFGHWLGYVNSAAVQNVTIANPEGTWQADDRYVTVTDNRATLYSDFNWTKKQAATDVMLQTFKSTGKYHNLNGLTYLSLYDKDGNWRGYINQQSITAGVSDGGAWLPANAYTTFTAANVNAYADFNQQKVATSGAGLVNQTVNISGQYHAFGGVVYYSIYDVRGKWLGYVDASQVKTTSSAAGLWLPHDGYLTTTQSGQMIYTNLDSFAGGRTTTANYQRTFRIMGEYKHYNGATYYSLYDGNGNWMGYLNSALGSESKEAQGVWMNYNANVLITASNAALYSSFFNMTRDTSSLYGGVYQVSGKYSHVNGTTYYSLYDGNRWLGYLASWATVPYELRFLNVPYVSQFRPIMAPDGCAPAALSMALQAVGVNPSLSYLMNNLPMAGSVPGGQAGSIYGGGFQYVITPAALTVYAQNWDKNARNISGASTTQIIAEVVTGHPVLYYGFSPYQKSGDYNRNHCHVIAGFDPNRGFEIMDPGYNTQFDRAGSAGGNSRFDHGPVYWISLSSFESEYAHQYGSEAVKRAIAF